MTHRLFVAALVLLPSQNAHAQGKPAEPAAAAPAATPTTPIRSADESIYVVQRRTYSKRGKLELTPLFYTSLNNK
ncbi:MAG: hypothetical protein HYZ27_04545, partial [Deltaproteobacteria bacterium]|nr:hypothetical protein [Deltaproteobacteria bacterium]